MNYEHKAIMIEHQPQFFEEMLNHYLIPYLNDGWEILLQTPVSSIEVERRGDKKTELCVTFLIRKKIIL